MAEEKTITVDSIVYDELERLKSESKAATHNEVLQRKLNLISDMMLEELEADLLESYFESINEVIQEINNIYAFEMEVHHENGGESLEFISPTSERTIAKIEFLEDGYIVYNRNQKGGMSQAGRAQGDPVLYGTSEDVTEGINKDEMVDNIKEKVTGAFLTNFFKEKITAHPVSL